MNKLLNKIYMAYTCLFVQIAAYQEMRTPMPVIYASDDATEDELTEIAAEQRELSGSNR